MKPSDNLPNKPWFARYDNRRIGRLILLSLTLKQIELLTVDEDAFTAITGDTLVLSAFCTARGQKRFVLGFLEKPLASGETVSSINFDEVGHDVVQITSFFATSGGREYVGLSGDPENISDDLFKMAMNFFGKCSGTFMSPDAHTSDLRMIGDTACTVMRMRDRITIMQNLIVLGFSTNQHLLIAKPRVGSSLYMQSLAKLSRFPEDIDSAGCWQPLKGIDNKKDVFRVGRLIARGNQIIAPIATRQGDKIMHGEITIDLATNVVAIESTATDKFLITASMGSDSKVDSGPLKLVTYDEDGALGVQASVTGYARYCAAAEAQQSA